MNCRHCKTFLSDVFIDLVNAPPSNSFLVEEDLVRPEIFYPLKVFVCRNCWLVQTDEMKSSSEIFNSEYAYYSSYSSTWIEHSRRFAEMICDRLSLNGNSQVIEIASNDGYLLQFFKAKGIPCFGVEPAGGAADVARSKGIETIGDFFGRMLSSKFAEKGIIADLIVGNNVLAHTPDINDFVAGLPGILSPSGTVTMEFPHLLRLIENSQFDTIYHEHFSYLSLTAVSRIFMSFGLEIYDVEELTTHGGSLRIYARHAKISKSPPGSKVGSIISMEKKFGLFDLAVYYEFQKKANKIKYDFLDFLTDAAIGGKKIIGYGAAAKGNTLLNYCGVKKDMISFVVDASPAKQGKFLPGSHIPVVAENEIKKFQPDFVIIFPWNISEEIMSQIEYIREWGGKFVITIPKLKICG